MPAVTRISNRKKKTHPTRGPKSPSTSSPDKKKSRSSSTTKHLKQTLFPKSDTSPTTVTDINPLPPGAVPPDQFNVTTKIHPSNVTPAYKRWWLNEAKAVLSATTTASERTNLHSAIDTGLAFMDNILEPSTDTEPARKPKNIYELLDTSEDEEDDDSSSASSTRSTYADVARFPPTAKPKTVNRTGPTVNFGTIETTVFDQPPQQDRTTMPKDPEHIHRLSITLESPGDVDNKEEELYETLKGTIRAFTTTHEKFEWYPSVTGINKEIPAITSSTPDAALPTSLDAFMENYVVYLGWSGIRWSNDRLYFTIRVRLPDNKQPREWIRDTRRRLEELNVWCYVPAVNADSNKCIGWLLGSYRSLNPDELARAVYERTGIVLGFRWRPVLLPKEARPDKEELQYHPQALHVFLADDDDVLPNAETVFRLWSKRSSSASYLLGIHMRIVPDIAFAREQPEVDYRRSFMVCRQKQEEYVVTTADKRAGIQLVRNNHIIHLDEVMDLSLGRSLTLRQIFLLIKAPECPSVNQQSQEVQVFHGVTSVDDSQDVIFAYHIPDSATLMLPPNHEADRTAHLLPLDSWQLAAQIAANPLPYLLHLFPDDTDQLLLRKCFSVLSHHTATGLTWDPKLGRFHNVHNPDCFDFSDLVDQVPIISFEGMDIVRDKSRLASDVASVLRDTKSLGTAASSFFNAKERAADRRRDRALLTSQRVQLANYKTTIAQVFDLAQSIADGQSPNKEFPPDLLHKLGQLTGATATEECPTDAPTPNSKDDDTNTMEDDTTLPSGIDDDNTVMSDTTFQSAHTGRGSLKQGEPAPSND